MKRKIRALKEAIVNAINLRKIVDSQIQKQLRIQEMKINAKLMNEVGISKDLYNGRELIVSLTSYGRRIYQVHLVIETLLEQTLKPNRIILWLDETEITRSDLPLNLLILEKRGLQIEFCENLRSYKKLIPSLRRYPQALIITTDDDILYADDFVERLYKAYQKDPTKIHFYRGHEMKQTNGILQPYNSWPMEIEANEPSIFLFPTSGGGVMYSSDLLAKEIMDIAAFTVLAPTADDVWFKAMSMKKGVLCQQVRLECPYRKKYIFLDAMDDMGLANINMLQNQNDSQINNVFTKYNLYKLLK